MSNFKSGFSNVGHSQGRAVGKRGPTITENFKRVVKQVEADTFCEEDTELIKEIVLIVAEVLTLSDDFTVSIAGDKLPCSLVKDVYGMLEREHLEFVLDRFKGINYKITHRKSYFRTALYNSVFECNSDVINDLKINGF